MSDAVPPLSEPEHQQQRIIVAPPHTARSAAATLLGRNTTATDGSVSIVRRHPGQYGWEKAGLTI